MWKHLSMWMGQEFYNYYIIKFCSKSVVKFVTTNGTDTCVNTVRATHNGDERMVALEPSEFVKILLFEGGDLKFNVHEHHIILQGLRIDLIKDFNRIPSVKSVEYLIYTPNIEEESYSSILSLNQLNRLTAYVNAVESEDFMINTFSDKPILVQDYKKAWKVLLGYKNG